MTEEASKSREELTELIESARLGNSEAMSRLLSFSRAALRERAQRELPLDLQARVDASDVIQEVLFEASTDFASFRGQSSREWRGWLQRVLANNVIQNLRRHIFAEKRSLRKEHPLEGHNNLVMEDSSPSRRVRHAEQVEWLTALQSKLEPDFQTALRLRYWDDYSLAQIATTMDLTKDRAARLLRKAVEALHREITERVESDDPL